MAPATPYPQRKSVVARVLAAKAAEFAEAHQDDVCVCGHQGYLHDDGLDACAACEGCPDFVPGSVAEMVAALFNGEDSK